VDDTPTEGIRAEGGGDGAAQGGGNGGGRRRNRRRGRGGKGRGGGQAGGEPGAEGAAAGGQAQPPQSQQARAPQQGERPERSERGGRDRAGRDRAGQGRQQQQPQPGQPAQGAKDGGNRERGNRDRGRERGDKQGRRGERGQKGERAAREERDAKASNVPPQLRLHKDLKPEQGFKHMTRRYGVAFYDTFPAAKADLARLADEAQKVDQLNVVIKADGNMDDPELIGIGSVKVFAGAAWTLIHERRKQDGWYDEPR
jgi:hypothetical protein